MHPLEAISPIDGRSHDKTKILSEFFSEKALMQYKIRVEIEYLIFLSKHPHIDTRAFSDEEIQYLQNIWHISLNDAQTIKALETTGYHNIPATNHDLKAVEYFIKETLKDTSLADSLEWIHFGITSADINNIAYGLMISEGLEHALLPTIKDIYKTIEQLAHSYKDTIMLARTHGQTASPTTLGKEFKIFANRLDRQIQHMMKQEILVKCNGATGNYNAQYIAYPDVDWIAFSEDFIKNLNRKNILTLKTNLLTTQIEPYDSFAELCDTLRRFNTILIDFCQDMWRYISDDWIRQKTVDGEVGSSTMPHKINPINFENSEGNLGIANTLLQHFATKLPISRLQRDLSDSTVKRNIGVAYGHCLVAYSSLKTGLAKIIVHKKKINEDLMKHPEVIAEAIQTILRREGIAMPYEQLNHYGLEVHRINFE